MDNLGGKNVHVFDHIYELHNAFDAFIVLTSWTIWKERN